jgi:hypothetical protein
VRPAACSALRAEKKENGPREKRRSARLKGERGRGEILKLLKFKLFSNFANFTQT